MDTSQRQMRSTIRAAARFAIFFPRVLMPSVCEKKRRSYLFFAQVLYRFEACAHNRTVRAAGPVPRVRRTYSQECRPPGWRTFARESLLEATPGDLFCKIHRRATTRFVIPPLLSSIRMTITFRELSQDIVRTSNFV